MKTLDQAWQDLCEKDDRTSPEEYPEMCLITREELAGYVTAERDRIAEALDYEASVTPCAEDAVVVRDCARLVRADFSYEEAEKLL